LLSLRAYSEIYAFIFMTRIGVMIRYLLAKKRPDRREKAIWLRSNTKDNFC
jgi:hypothetical protein